MLQKIQELITEIQMTREKSRDTASQSSDGRRYHKKWTLQEENQLCDLIVRFGTDFTLLEEYFPHKSRKQIKKKYRQLFEHRQHTLQKMEQEFEKQRRKSFFDEEILEQGKGNHGKKGEDSPDIQQQSFQG